MRWSQHIGTAEPAGTGQPIRCTDLTPEVGITSTPVIDTSDPTNPTVYTVYRTWDGVNASSAQVYFDARNVVTGAVKAGFPVAIGGAASNDPQWTFNPVVQNQRPGLLLLNGRVYAAFASFCDNDFYTGWIAGVSTAGVNLRLWTTEPGQSTAAKSPDAGIWQSGGGLASDGTSIFFSSGNGTYPTPVPTTPVPGSQATTWPLSNSVVRAQVNGDGTLTAADFFTPNSTQYMSDNDFDLGSSNPILLPDGFASSVVGPSHPHLALAGGKTGDVFLLDRDNLGGFPGSAAPSNVPPAIAQVQIQKPAGSPSAVYAHPAVWPGDGGYIYVTTAEYGTPGLTALQVVTSGGAPAIHHAADSPAFGNLSGSPLVTSDGSTAGSALVWVAERRTGAEVSGELRAYEAVPNGTAMTKLWSYPIGNATKFSEPVSDNGRVYIGTADGNVYGFGQMLTVAPVPVDLGAVRIGTIHQQAVVVTNRTTSPLGIASVAITSPYSLAGDSCSGQSVAALSSYTITVANAVAMPSGVHAGTLTISPSASGQITVGLTLTASYQMIPALYSDLLHRAPDGAGLVGWTTYLDGGATYLAMATNFTSSAEYRSDLANALYGGGPPSPYPDLLQRAPDAGSAGWASLLGSGATYQMVAAGIASSGEYYSRRGGGSDDGYVTALYSDFLHRAPEQAGLSGWKHALASGLSRYAAALAIVSGPEADQNLVASLYTLYLHRSGGASDIQGWANAMSRGMRIEQVIDLFVSGPEYVADTNAA